MLLPFLNLLLTLLFLGSIVFVVYRIALFIARKSKQTKIKAIKLSILPILYISGVLIYSKHKLVETRKEIVKELSGKYLYNDTVVGQDSTMISAAELYLLSDKTFKFKNLQQPDPMINGKWDIDDRTTDIQFINSKGKILWQAYKKNIAKRPAIIFNNNGKKIKFLKVD